MPLARREFLHFGSAVATFIPTMASAQTYPTRPVRIIVGFATGGVADIAARLIGQSLSERLGQPFVVENRAGAATNIATEAVIRAPPTATRSCLSMRRTQSTRRSTKISSSILSATSQPSPASASPRW
jgi:tripartite-type tricarboxylate transporter receptor subunit TctC